MIALPLAGCQQVERLSDSQLSSDTPVDWWHQLEGGAIAQQRPPPPGVGAPYPNLAQVPTETPKVDAAQQRALQSQLMSERDQVRRDVVQDPVTPSPPNAPVAPPPLPPNPDASHVVADAATTSTPPPEAAPASAPAVSTVSPQAPNPPPPAPTPPAPRPAAAVAASARTGAVAASTPAADVPAVPPTVPDAPPPLPVLSGLSASLVPAASRPGPPGVAISFRRGSAELPSSAEDALSALVARRGGGPVAVRAGGDAGPSPAAQAAALPLAFRRADAVRAALLAAGVPPGDVRTTALAGTRGTRIDLIQSP